MHIVTSIDAASGGICAHNAYNTEFTGRTAFFCTDASTFTVTGDRHEFIGRNGNLQRPQAMGKTRLSGKTGAGFDPCAAIQIAFELAPGQTRNIVFTLGLADQKQQTAQQLIAQLRGSHAADEALIRVHQHWADTLNMVQVTTPDKTLNILANGWLPSDHRLPLVGAQRLLSVWWRVWLPRSIAGYDGARTYGTSTGARSDFIVGCAPIH
jgi:cellobiose phosphorylase